MNQSFLWIAAALAGSVMVAGCEKSTEVATQRAVEKMIESSMSNEGTKGKVDLTQGGATISSTDASGKTTQMEVGTVKVTEADVGIAFYPGAIQNNEGGMRIASSDGRQAVVGLHSSDTPEQVATFYRAKLKGKVEGAQYSEIDTGDGGHSLTMVDDKNNQTIQVQVSKSEKGTDIQLFGMREKR